MVDQTPLPRAMSGSSLSIQEGWTACQREAQDGNSRSILAEGNRGVFNRMVTHDPAGSLKSWRRAEGAG